jgi:hypothetical protein
VPWFFEAAPSFFIHIENFFIHSGSPPGTNGTKARPSGLPANRRGGLWALPRGSEMPPRMLHRSGTRCRSVAGWVCHAGAWEQSRTVARGNYRFVDWVAVLHNPTMLPWRSLGRLRPSNLRSGGPDRRDALAKPGARGGDYSTAFCNMKVR